MYLCKKIAKLSINQPKIVLFHSNLLQTLITMYHRLSRSKGQRSRSQRGITYH